MLNLGEERTGVAPVASEMSFKLDARSTDEVRRISAVTGLSSGELLAVALRFLFIAADARDKNQHLLITSHSGYPIKELVLEKANA